MLLSVTNGQSGLKEEWWLTEVYVNERDRWVLEMFYENLSFGVKGLVVMLLKEL